MTLIKNCLCYWIDHRKSDLKDESGAKKKTPNVDREFGTHRFLYMQDSPIHVSQYVDSTKGNQFLNTTIIINVCIILISFFMIVVFGKEF